MKKTFFRQIRNIRQRIGTLFSSAIYFRIRSMFHLIVYLVIGVEILWLLWELTQNILVIFASTIFIAIIIFLIAQPFTQVNSLLITNFWSDSKQMRRWLRRWLGQETLRNSGVESVTVVGVASSDVIFLFEELVNVVSSGLNINVCIMDWKHRDMQVGGILSELESPDELEKKVHKPAAEKLQELAERYENREIARNFRKYKVEIENKNFRDQAVLAKVCRGMWSLVGHEAHRRVPNTKGVVKIYYLKDLPFARQWLIGDKAYVYSLYVGYPGVGVDNPVLGCSTLENPSEDVGKICLRAKKHLDSFVESLGSPVEISPRKRRL